MKKFKAMSLLCLTMGFMVVLFSCFVSFAGDSGVSTVTFNYDSQQEVGSADDITLSADPADPLHFSFDTSTVNVLSNVPYNLSAKGTDFTATGDKSFSINKLSINNAALNADKTTPTVVTTSNDPIAADLVVGYDLNLDGTEYSANYSATVTYTISAIVMP